MRELFDKAEPPMAMQFRAVCFFQREAKALGIVGGEAKLYVSRKFQEWLADPVEKGLPVVEEKPEATGQVSAVVEPERVYDESEAEGPWTPDSDMAF